MRTEPEPARHRAFISYSHADAVIGRRLHRRLDRYRLPGRLVGQVTARGPVPRRLGPIFRDREDLAAADDLTAEVRTAIQNSGCLIVVCSPAARRSVWVSREIELFRRLHPDRPILAALVLGEPADAFPPALLRDSAGGETREPLAADLRREGDGERLGFLKLAAGIVGVGLDELVQRDTQRQLRGVTAVTGAAVTIAVVMAVLAFVALRARADAERQRAEAEGMVEFMLTDLRDKLQGVGRLDILSTVNRRALKYYEGQDIDRLSAPSLERRARVLLAMGEDDQTRGDLPSALRQFQQARRTTAALLQADPDNPDRIWAHGQSEYWVGAVAFQRNQTEAAHDAFESYRDLSERLIALQPHNPVYLREAGYAEGNLCSLALSTPSALKAALDSCGLALSRMEAAAAAAPDPESYASDLANRHAWLADALRADQRPDEARAHRMAEEQLLVRLTAADPRNMEIRERWVGLYRAYAALDFEAGHPDRARARLIAARDAADAMVAHEPANARWTDLRRLIGENLTLLKTLEETDQ